MTDLSDSERTNQHYRTRAGLADRNQLWRDRADQAIAEWHRRRGTIDPTAELDSVTPGLTLRERFSSFRLGRIAREVVR